MTLNNNEPINELIDKLTNGPKETFVVVKGYEGPDRLRAGLIYEMLMEKKESKEHMDMGRPSHKVEIMIEEVTKMEREDVPRNETIYKVEFKAVVCNE